MPYMQTKLAQTTLMKSLAHSISNKQNTNTDLDILISSFWTNYPLLTDAILKNDVGSKEDCMHPSILSKTVEELLFNTKNRQDYIGREIIDKTFLEQQNIDITPFKISKNKEIDNLDNLFLKHLQKQKPKNREFLLPGV
tara:strand:+ start:429 stop:845 length:417 start_codon:yes stop_codon:yes gene_type:complete